VHGGGSRAMISAASSTVLIIVPHPVCWTSSTAAL